MLPARIGSVVGFTPRRTGIRAAPAPSSEIADGPAAARRAGAASEATTVHLSPRVENGMMDAARDSTGHPINWIIGWMDGWMVVAHPHGPAPAPGVIN